MKLNLKRPRVTVRRLIVLIALVAVVLCVYREFDDGLPPRYVVRGIPARIAKLRPGMSRKETTEILGLNESWLNGGLSARSGSATTRANLSIEAYFLRDMKLTPGNSPRDGMRSKGMISLEFRQGAPRLGFIRDATDRLETAKFTSDGRTIAEMPTR